MSQPAPPSWLADVGLLSLRLAFGGLMLVEHGIGKMQRLTGPDPIRFADPFGLGPEISLALAAGAESICAALLAVGLLTRLNAIPLVITMLVAAFVAHGGDPLADKEPALMYLAAYVAIFALGPGRLSLSHALRGVLPAKGPLAFLSR